MRSSARTAMRVLAPNRTDSSCCMRTASIPINSYIGGAEISGADGREAERPPGVAVEGNSQDRATSSN